jgi:DNA-binding transcriptional regulator of glucitol operon
MTLGILAGPLFCLFGFKAYDKKVLAKAKASEETPVVEEVVVDQQVEQPKKKNKKNKPKKETTNVDSKPKETTTKPKKQNAKTKVEKEESEGEWEEVGKSKKTNTNYQTLQQKIKANYDDYLNQF